MGQIKNKYFLIILTILLGAIGSGFWDLILKPMLSGASKFILDIVTFGIESYKDQVYIEIAKGLHEEQSLAIYAFLIFIFAGILMFLTSFASVTSLPKGKRPLIIKYLNTKIGNDKELRIKFKSRLRFFLKLNMLFLLVLIATDITIRNYRNNAIVHFNQMFAIVAPDISEKERKIFISRFAQIKGSKGYKKIIDNLNTIAKNNNRHVPKFTIW